MSNLVSSKSAAELERDVRSLMELKNSRGWALLTDKLQQDILKACIEMCSNPISSEKEIDFRRGAIYAASNVPNSVDVLIGSLQTDLLIKASEDSTRSIQKTPSTLNASA